MPNAVVPEMAPEVTVRVPISQILIRALPVAFPMATRFLLFPITTEPVLILLTLAFPLTPTIAAPKIPVLANPGKVVAVTL